VRRVQCRNYRKTLRGANHFAYSDGGGVLGSDLLRRALRLFGILEIDGRRQLAVTTYCLLKERSTSPLKLSSPLYPELEIAE
jgi:hypothetical protein